MKKIILSARVHPQVLERLAAAAEIAGARYDYTSAELIRFAITDTIRRYTGESGVELTMPPPPLKDQVEAKIETLAEPAKTQLKNLYTQYKGKDINQRVLAELAQDKDNPELAQRATELLTLLKEYQT